MNTQASTNGGRQKWTQGPNELREHLGLRPGTKF